MADVIDIIHKLSYDVDDSGLKDVNAQLQQQIVNITMLKSRLDELNRAYGTAGAIRQQEQLKASIEKTTAALTQQVKAMQQGGGSGGFNFGKVYSDAITGGLGEVFGKGVGEASKVVADFIAESSKMGEELTNIQGGFAQLNQPGLLDKLRTATKGTVSDLELMKNALAANDMDLPLARLPEIMEFAREKARQLGLTTEDVEAKIKEGIGSNSTEAFEKLGIKTDDLNAEFKKTGDFGTAVFNEISKAINNSSDAAGSLADRNAQVKAGLDNMTASLGQTINDAKLIGGAYLEDIFGFTSHENQLEKVRGLMAERDRLADENARAGAEQQKVYNEYFKGYMDEYVHADADGRARIEAQAKAMYESLLQKDAQFWKVLGVPFMGVNSAVQNAYGLAQGQMIPAESKIITDANRNVFNVTQQKLKVSSDADLKQLPGLIKAQRDKDEGSDRGKYDQLMQLVRAEMDKRDGITHHGGHSGGGHSHNAADDAARAAEQRQREYERTKDAADQAREQLEKERLEDNVKGDEGVLKAGAGKTPQLADHTKLAYDRNRQLEQEQQERKALLEKQFTEANYEFTEYGEKRKALDQQLADEEENITRQKTANDLQAYKDYFDQLDKLIDERSDKIAKAEKNKTNASLTELNKLYLAGKISKGAYDYQSQQTTLSGNLETYQGQYNDKQKALADAQAQQEADAKRSIAVGSLGSPEAQADDAAKLKADQELVDKLKGDVGELGKNIGDTQISIKVTQTKHIQEQIDKYSELVKSVVAAYEQIYEAQQRALEREIQIREQRVQQANILAARGNTQALQQEQTLLDKAERQRELAAKRQVEINAALSASEAVLAVVRAAAEGDPYTIAIRVIAAVASIAAGVASIKATTESSASVGFAQGGYTGDGGRYQVAGPVHRGEFVFDQERTRMYRPLFEAIHSGVPMFERMPDDVALRRYEQNTTINNAFATRDDLNMLAEKMDDVAHAISDIKVEQHIGENGVRQMVQTSVRKERKRWKV